MAEHPASLIVLFIAGIVVTVAVGGAVADQALRFDDAMRGAATDDADDLRTDVEILNDPGDASGEYNATNDTLTLYVKNVGKRTIPHDESTVDVLVDGRYVAEMNVTLLDGDSWSRGVVAEIEATVNLTRTTTHRAKVVVDGARATYEFRAAPPDPPLDRTELVYANGASELRSIAPDGTVTAYDATVAAIGPKEVDFDDDDRLEIPYVTSGGDLKLIDETDETMTLVTGDAKSSSALLGVGTWRDTTSVYYVNTSDSNAIYRVRPGETPTEVSAGGSAVAGEAVAGVADFTDDGDADLTYVGTTSEEVRYVDGDATQTTGVGPGSNNNYGVGAPRQFDGTAPPRVPLVDDSQNVQLLASDGTTTTVLSDATAVKTAAAGLDWTGDGDLEVLYVNSDTTTLYYVTLGGSKTQVTDADGTAVSVDTTVGVA